MLINIRKQDYKLPDTHSCLFDDQDCGDHSGYSRNRRGNKGVFLSFSKYHFCIIIVSSWQKECSTAGLCQTGLVLDEVDEHIGWAIQGGQEVGEVGQVLCTSDIQTIYSWLYNCVFPYSMLVPCSVCTVFVCLLDDKLFNVVEINTWIKEGKNNIIYLSSRVSGIHWVTQKILVNHILCNWDIRKTWGTMYVCSLYMA